MTTPEERTPRPRRAAAVAGALVAAALAMLATVATLSCGLRAERPMAERLFEAGRTYEQFLASDTAQRALWAANGEDAPNVVDPLLVPLQRLRGHWHLLVVGEPWCSDGVNSLPYFARLADRLPAVDMRIVDRATGAALLAEHPLDGRGAIPLVVLLDDRFVERGVWVEQPAPLRALVAANEHVVSSDSLRVLVRGWYLDDGGATATRELVRLIERAARER